ncbi:MAG: peptide transporter, partial [Wolinella succinogenes]
MKPQPLSSPLHRGQASLDIGLALLLFLFALGARLAWVVDFGAYEEFLHKGILMINTNDGYYYAEGARDLIAGFHQENDLSPLHAPLSLLTAWLYHLTPFSLEALLLGMPLFFGASIVFPLYLLGKELASRNVGFFGALLGGVAVSYYNRTMAGYYDTDMLVLVL